MAVDKRNFIPVAIVLVVEGRDDITLDISTPDSRKKLSEHPVKIKEGATYNLKLVFRVRFDVINGMKYLEERKFRGITFEKTDSLMVSPTLVFLSRSDVIDDSILRVLMRLSWRASLILKSFVSSVTCSCAFSKKLTPTSRRGRGSIRYGGVWKI